MSEQQPPASSQEWEPSEPTLAPCKCGSLAALERRGTAPLLQYRYSCPSCKRYVSWDETPEDALKWWNENHSVQENPTLAERIFDYTAKAFNGRVPATWKSLDSEERELFERMARWHLITCHQREEALRREIEKLAKKYSETHQCLLNREESLKREGERWVKAKTELDEARQEIDRLKHPKIFPQVGTKQ